MEISNFSLAWLSLTYACNSKCRWCYANCNDAASFASNVMPYERTNEILDLIKDVGVRQVILIGGEPTVYSHIKEVVKQTKDKGFDCSIVTNGRKLSDKDFAHEIRNAGLKYASVSIEGSNAQVHDNTTQIAGSFEQGVSGLENLIKEGVIVATNTVISTLNSNDLKNIVDRFGNYKLHAMTFNIAGPCVSSTENNQYQLPFQEAIDTFEEVYRYGRDKGIKIKLTTPMPFCNFSGDLLPFLKQNDVISPTPCQLAHGKNFVVDYNADVIPCTHLSGFSLFNLYKDGKLRTKEEFLKGMNSVSSQQFRQSMNRRASTKCDGCEEHCSGGCPLYWLKLNPNEVITRKEKLVTKV